MIKNTKKCSKCGKIKGLCEFRKNKNHKDGFSSSCKVCDALRDNNYYHSHKNLIGNFITKKEKQELLEKDLKKCSGCKEIYDLNSYDIDNNSKDGRYCYCSACRKKNYLKTHPQSQEKIDLLVKNLYKCRCCKEILKIENFGADKNSKSGFRSICKHCTRIASQNYSKTNPEKSRESKDLWILNNPEKDKECKQNWNIRNPNYRKLKKEKDLNFKLATILRGRLNIAVKSNQKAGSAVRDLGCTIPEFKQYIEAKFYPHPETGEGMTWKNYGLYGWHFDHRFPLSKLNLSDRKDFLKACHYTNLQPLWAKENLNKGNKIEGEINVSS